MDLPFGRDRVWEALTTAQGLESWLCDRASVNPVIGGAWDMWWEPALERGMRLDLLSIDRPRLLDLECVDAGRLDPGEGGGYGGTRITIVLFPALDGTRLELTHSGWGETGGWMLFQRTFERFWWGALEDLRVALRR